MVLVADEQQTGAVGSLCLPLVVGADDHDHRVGIPGDGDSPLHGVGIGRPAGEQLEAGDRSVHSGSELDEYLTFVTGDEFDLGGHRLAAEPVEVVTRFGIHVVEHQDVVDEHPRAADAGEPDRPRAGRIGNQRRPCPHRAVGDRYVGEGVGHGEPRGDVHTLRCGGCPIPLRAAVVFERQPGGDE